MKTSQVNLQSKTKLSTRDAIISFMDKPVVKIAVLLFLILFMSLIVRSQNSVALKSNNATLASLNKNMIKEKALTTDPTFSINKEGALLNTHNNFMKDSINLLNNSVSKATAMVTSYFHGVDDADDCYQARKSGKGLILVSTLVGSPVVGLISTIACSSTSPKRKNLDIPNSTYVGNESYMAGYKSESHFIKKHHTWQCFVGASVIWVCVIGFLVH